jgi:hypothetical protein
MPCRTVTDRNPTAGAPGPRCFASPGRRPPARGWLLLVGLLLALGLAPRPGLAADEADWQVELETKFMFNSHTSYEFGNPTPPFQRLSRLEFPMESIWVGAKARRRLGRASLGLEYLTSLADHESGVMKDSDWDDDNAPTRRTIYSESKCRMRPSIQLAADLDLQLADLVGLPEAVSLRPVVGFRWQRLQFVAHDGMQYTYGTLGEVTDLSSLVGDGISFEQNWYQYFAGLRLGYEWTDPPLLRWVRLNAQGDWSYVEGKNLDKHLLRGDRTTRESTVGQAWHATLGVTLGLTEHLGLGVEGEYLTIESTGSHRWKQVTQDSSTLMSWSHGVRVWSEQSSVAVKLHYGF